MVHEMIYVTDTHSFLWYLSEDKKLSKTAKSVFDEAEKGNATIVIPTIVLAESLHILDRKGKGYRKVRGYYKKDRNWVELYNNSAGHENNQKN